MALRLQGTTLWDVTRGSDIRKYWTQLRHEHLPKQVKPLSKVRHDASGAKVLQITNASRDYPGGGAAGILSGSHADVSNHRALWMGFHGTDFTILLDLGKALRIESVVVGMLTNIQLGIFPASDVRVSAGLSRELLRTCGQQPGGKEMTANAVSPIRSDIKVDAGGVMARSVQIDVRSIGMLPNWHPAAGQKAWLFIDNVMINPKAHP